MQLLGGQDSLLLKHYPILADFVLFNAESFLYQVLEQYLLELQHFPLFKFLQLTSFIQPQLLKIP